MNASTGWIFRCDSFCRTGSNVGATAQICEWQFMQILVAGILANEEVSTVAWQYLQSIPKPPAWCS